MTLRNLKMSGFQFISLSILITCVIIIANSAEVSEELKMENERTLFEYERQLSWYPKTTEPRIKYGCENFNIQKINEFIKQGEGTLQLDKASDKNIHVIIGKNSSLKTNFGNILANLSFHHVPQIDLDIYPRYIDITPQSSVIYEAADLIATTVNRHISGIYLLNMIAKQAKGISLIMAWKRTEIWAVWEYFKCIANFNPKTGLFGLKDSESFLVTNIAENELFDGAYSKFLFGSNPIAMPEFEYLKDFGSFARFFAIDRISKNTFVGALKFPLFDGSKCLKTRFTMTVHEGSLQIMKHFKKIENSSELGTHEKMTIFEDAVNNITEIENSMSLSTEIDAGVINKLVAYAKDLHVEDLGPFQSMTKYSRVISLLNSNIQKESWTEGLKSLSEYVINTRNAFELQSYFGKTLFECRNEHALLNIRNKLYEVDFEVQTSPEETVKIVENFLEENKHIIGENNMQLYEEFIRHNPDKDLELRNFLERIRKYNESKCDEKIKVHHQCDTLEVENFLKYMRLEAADLETNHRGRAAIIFGTENSGKQEVANILAGLAINSSTTKDTNVYPEFLADPVNRTYSIYSAPAVSSNKTVSEKLASHFFSQQILQSSNAAKLIITISQFNIKEEVRLLLGYIWNLVNRNDEFIKSIGFVITHVKLSRDETMDAKVVSLSKSLMIELQNMADDANASNDTKEVASLLLSRKEETAKKVGILVQDENYYKENRDRLTNILENQLNFSMSDNSPFSRMLTAQEKELSDCAITSIKKRIPKDMSELLKPLEDQFKEKEQERIGDYETLIKTFDKALSDISVILQDISDSKNTRNILSSFVLHMADFLIKTPYAIVSDVENDAIFLKNSGYSFDKDIADGFKNITKFLQDSRRWYYFLMKLNTWLGKYETMKNVDNYRESGRKLLAKIRTAVASKRDVEKFISAVDSIPKKAFKKLLGDTTLNSTKLSHLGPMIDRMFTAQMDVDCFDGITFCKGTYVLISTCLERRCEDTKSMEVRAANRFYLDVDVDGKGQISFLAIFAPIWHVIGNRSISVDGEDGQLLEAPKANNAEKDDGRGRDGKPGLPGGPAGHFLGIAETILAGDGLRITAIGGKGGDGQDGGDGGAAGIPVVVIPSGRYKKYPLPGFKPSCDKHSCVHYRTDSGLEGGIGGNGGAAGYGGFRGSVTLITLNGESSHVPDVDVREGYLGKGGEGGLGGMGRTVEFQIVSEAGTVTGVDWEMRGGYPKVEEIGRNGKRGENAVHTVGRKDPETLDTKPNFAVTINKYKVFVRDKLDSKSNNYRARKFLRHIANSTRLNSFYDTFSYGDDYKRLEVQSFHLKKKTSVVEYFDVLLERIANFSSNATINEEEKKVLRYMYTAILGKLAGERSNEKYVVVNPAVYLENILKDFNRLEELKNTANANRYQDEYLRNVKSKTDEANNLVEKEIAPVVEKYKEELNQQIDNIANEVVELKKANQVEKAALLRKRSQLRNTVIWRKATNILATVTSFLSFLGPQFTLAGQAIYSSAKSIETLATSDAGTDITNVMAKIPPAVQDKLAIIYELIEDTRNRLSDQLSEIQRRLNGLELTDIVDAIKSKVNDTNESLKKIDPKSLDPNTTAIINQLRSDLSSFLTDKKGETETREDSESDRIIETISIIQSILNTPENRPKKKEEKKDTFLNDPELEEVGRQIKENEETLKRLQIYQERIYTQMLPMVNEIAGRLSSIGAENNGKSNAQLDIAQWKTEEYLSDMLRTLSKLTEGFEANEEFEYILNKVKRGTTTMLNVFHRIADNQDKAELAVYLKNINGNKGSSVHDPRLSKLLNELEISIKINLILETYDRGYKTFLQSFFPFGVELIKGYSLPQGLVLGNSTNNLVTFVGQRVRAMLRKINTKGTSTDSPDTEIVSDAPFYEGNDEFIPPFYVWRYEENKRALSYLLKGRHVEMYADIMRLTGRNAERNAIKFNELRLAFLAQKDEHIEKVNKVMNELEITLETLGTFEYKCGDKYYQINNDVFSVQFSHDYDNDSPNDAYTIIRDNSAIFSPYGMWNVTVVSDVYNVTELMAELKDIPIDIHLYGEGFFVAAGSAICKTNLDLIYTRDPRNKIDNE